MNSRNIIVIGASAGGFEALKQLTAGLPADLGASIFIVWHMSPDVHGILPQVLNSKSSLIASNAYDGEPIVPNRIYVAPPDRHLLIEEGRVRVTHGPRENRFRPAVDPLFRSAAAAYGPRVIGVILSGALDDGSSGLWAVKHYGGIAVVQDPADAEVPSMPQSAMREVAVDHVIPIAAMAALLQKLSREQATEIPTMNEEDRSRTKLEVGIAGGVNAFEKGIMEYGELTPYTCPECHGVLSALRDGGRIRYRCHTGHAFSAYSLLATLTERIEDSIWSGIRGIEESILLLNHIGDHLAEANKTRQAAGFFQKAVEAKSRIELLHKAVLAHEQLTAERLEEGQEEDT